MNCLEFRRALAVDPADATPAFVAHREACARCADAYAAAQGFERTLERALRAPVPPRLAEEVLLRQTTESLHAARPRRLRGWALAAGLVVALGAGGLGFRAWQASRPVTELAVAHLAHEPYALTARGDVAPARVAAAFARAGAALGGAGTAVDYLQNCRIGGRAAVHMVVQRAEGPVTLLYVVGAPDARGESRFERGGLEGRALALGGGTLVLLASADRSFDALESVWRSAIAGSAGIALAAP